MKKRLLVFIIIIISISYNSCKEKDVNLLVNITSVGYNNTHIGYLGGTLGIMADVVAEKKVDKLEIGVRAASSKFKSVGDAGNFFSAWVIDTVYTDKYSGEINASFNEEIPIPLNVDIGEYLLNFTVTDKDGNKTSVSESFTLDYGK